MGQTGGSGVHTFSLRPAGSPAVLADRSDTAGGKRASPG